MKEDPQKTVEKAKVNRAVASRERLGGGAWAGERFGESERAGYFLVGGGSELPEPRRKEPAYEWMNEWMKVASTR